MHFHTSTTPVPPPTVTLGGHPLQVVEATKLLGIMLDNRLDWKQHIAIITQSASYRLYMLPRLKSLGIPQWELRFIFNTFILPKLTYASPSWFPSINTTQKQQLERIQKRACRIILGADYTTYGEALDTLDLASLDTVYQSIMRRFCEQLLIHPRHRDMLPPRLPPQRRPTRHTNILKPIRARTDRYKNSPIPTIVKLVNNN